MLSPYLHNFPLGDPPTTAKYAIEQPALYTMIHWEPIENDNSNDLDKTIDFDAKTTYTTEEDDDDASEAISALTDPDIDDTFHDGHSFHPRPEEDASYTTSCNMAHHILYVTDILQETISDAADVVSLLVANIDSPLYYSMKHRLARVADTVRMSASQVQSSVNNSGGCTSRHGREVREERARRRREEKMRRLERRRARYLAAARAECLAAANMWRDK